MFPSDRFAAFMAYCLNDRSPDRPGVTVIDVGQLFSELLDTLAAARYADELLHHVTYAGRMDVNEAASRYFAATVGRTIWMTNRAELTATHHVFLALCRRALGAGWTEADLSRCKEPPVPQEAVTALLSPGTFEHVARQLGACPATISPGNPAAAIGARDGNPWLQAGPRSVQVPEEISLWDAIACAPRQLRVLPSGTPFREFCWIVTDAMRSANRPFGEILRLGRGLCPFDWLDELSTNQVRGLNQFLSVLKASGGDDSFESWAEAWASAPVPTFRTFKVFWDSDIGHALRGPRSVMVGPGGVEIPDPIEYPVRILDAIEFGQRLALLAEAGIINDDERTLLEHINQERDLADLVGEPLVSRLLQARKTTLERLLPDLRGRIARGLSKLTAGWDG